jgi:hypothetical protein
MEARHMTDDLAWVRIETYDGDGHLLSVDRLSVPAGAAAGALEYMRRRGRDDLPARTLLAIYARNWEDGTDLNLALEA